VRMCSVTRTRTMMISGKQRSNNKDCLTRARIAHVENDYSVSLADACQTFGEGF
jgi:hypothetical protein